MSREYSDIEADADKLFRDAMQRVFSRRKQTVEHEKVECPRCGEFSHIPLYRVLCEGCWVQTGKPDGRRYVPPKGYGQSGERKFPAECSEIAYHGSKFMQGEW